MEKEEIAVYEIYLLSHNLFKSLFFPRISRVFPVFIKGTLNISENGCVGLKACKLRKIYFKKSVVYFVH